MNFLGAILTVVAIMMVLTLPLRRAILGVFLAVAYITQGEMIDIGGFHFTAIRFVLLAAFGRAVGSGEFGKLKYNRIDYALMAFAIYSGIITSIRVAAWQEQIGILYNVLLSFFVFRCFIKSWEDWMDLLPALAWFIVPLALAMVFESATGNNLFNLVGGAGDEWMRNDRIRCIGPFRGPHTAGIFGATLMPFFAGLIFLNQERRPYAIVGLLATTAITYTANSSGPLMGYLGSIIGLGFWRFRFSMRKVRIGIVVVLVLLGCTMKAPIWYIFAKISDVVGGDGWYRSYLMEQCFNHMSGWWLMGTANTGEWGATGLDGGVADLCNIYVSSAATAGLGSLILLIYTFKSCFRNLGLSLRAAREVAPEPEIILWCAGTALFAHVVTLFSVTYFDQMHVPWWGLLGMISSVSSTVANEAALKIEESPTEDKVSGEKLLAPV